MTRFTVRIELHNASWEQYEDLYERLTTQGFSDKITTGNGSVKMPPAEYNFDGTASKEEVLEKAKACASSVVKSFAVLVTESNGRIWHGLEQG